jgi:hypothetical protein
MAEKTKSKSKLTFVPSSNVYKSKQFNTKFFININLDTLLEFLEDEDVIAKANENGYITFRINKSSSKNAKTKHYMDIIDKSEKD